MANNIGLDFGTTYSVVSRLKNIQYGKNNEVMQYDLEACLPSEASHSPCQDSVVVRNADGSLVYGLMARDKTGKKGSYTYKGFKMMLAETDPGRLAARGYGEEVTPKFIVSSYIDDILQRHIGAYLDGQNIDKVVVGVPEIWFDAVNTIDCRSILEEIVSSYPYVKEAELVSEPAAACAFFTENYKKNKNQRYNGKILIVDYGGGTLDIALCNVRENGQCSEVSVIKRCGAGLNEEGFIGKAGLAYIEAVVKIAFRTLGKTDEEIVGNRFFYRWVNSVENALILQTVNIKETFEMCETMDRCDLDDPFHTIEYDQNEDELVITYGMLAEAYHEIIEPVLDEKLDEIIGYMDENGIDYGPSAGDCFKVAPVGGFCNYYLTQEQIEQKFKKCSGDKRFSDIINDRRDCEKAISYGAALIANGVIDFKQVSPYHLGIAGGSGTQIVDESICFAIHKGDDIVYNEPVFIKDETGTEIIFGGSHIPLLVFSLDDSTVPVNLQWGVPLKEYQEALTLDADYCKIGLSLDKSMIITLHKYALLDPNKPDEILSRSSVKLNDIYSVLGNLTRVRRV